MAEAPVFRAVAPKLLQFLSGCDLAGFNIKRYDLPLLIAEFRRAGLRFSIAGRSLLDVYQLYRDREPRDLAAAYAFYCGGKLEDAHQAGADAHATARILDVQLERYTDLPRTVDELHQHLTDADLGGWFRREEGELVFAVGKHTGRRLSEVAEEHPDYLQWMLKQPLFDDARGFVCDALNRARASVPLLPRQ